VAPETKLVTAIVDACVDFLAERGELNGKLRASVALHRAARRIVWVRHYYASAVPHHLDDAITELERLVGRPERESEI
jgi:hypothetical protein